MSEQNNKDQTQWKETPYLAIKGFLMGAADIVPGVSGGTMALITGIYDRLIFAIKSFDSKTIKHAFRFDIKGVFESVHWRFLLLLVTGMACAVIFFTRIVPLQVYMHTHAEIVYGLFFGLILGSVFMLIAEVDRDKREWKLGVPLAAGALFGIWVVTLVPADTPETFSFVFFSGTIAISAMVLPGISGSYILLILNKYDYILGLLGELGGSNTLSAGLSLMPFILGALTGLVIFSRILSWLLKNYYTYTIVVLIGFLIGSLYVIWPYQVREYSETVLQTEVYEADDPVVQSLLLNEPIPNTDAYKQLGEVVERGEEGEINRIEVNTITRKIVNTEPVNPWRIPDQQADKFNKTGGVAGMLVGLVMIFGISYLRKKG